MAPLAGYTDQAFRLVVRACTNLELPASQMATVSTPATVARPTITQTQTQASDHHGVGLAFTELICSDAVLAQTHKTMTLASTSEADQPLGMQLYGHNIDMLCEAARWAEGHGAMLIDINMGCPVDKVTKRHGGSKLLCEPDHAVQLAGAVVKSVKLPVTCKIRLGWDDTCIIGPELAPKLADVGVAAVTVHGRTTAQMFRDQVRLEGIARVVEAMKRKHPEVPVVGNGDVKSATDVRTMIDRTGCDGVMIGRGALGQPWIFRDAAYFLQHGQLPPTLSRSARIGLVMQHFDNMLRLREERHALNQIKQRMSWYSAHLQPWPGLRRTVQLVDSATGMREFLQQGICFGEQQPQSPGMAMPVSLKSSPVTRHELSV
ncbi:MAG: tRNA dihydrouridine synthase DusB [Phycisphaerales bacterium]|nr:tRNA dihydrouridine synthase DusB [Phycisphaerales bacterium]